MPTVNIPGKGLVRFPESMTPEQIQGVIENEIAPAQKSPVMEAIKTGASAVGSTVDKAGTAAYRGLSGVLGLPADLRNLVASGLPEGVLRDTYQKLNVTPGSADIKKFIFGTMGVPEVSATSNLGRMAQKGFEGLSATVLSGGTGPLSAAMGAGSGVGAELGAQAFPESNLAPAIGAVVGGGIPYGLSRFSPGVESLVRGATRNTLPSQVDDAIATQNAGRAIGSPVTGPEALNNPELLRLQRTVERSGNGGPLSALMASRPQTQRAAVSDVASQIAPLAPPREVKQGLVSAARSAVGTVEKGRTIAAKPFYEAASKEAMAPAILDDVFSTIDDQLTKVGTESDIGKQLTAYKQKLTSAISDRGAGVGPLDAIYKETRDAISKTKIEPGALDKEVKGVLRPINSALGNALSRGNQNIAMGRATYQTETPAVKAVTDSPVGDLIPRGGARPTFKQQAGVLLSPENARPETVTRAMRVMAKENPDAVSKWIANYVDTTMDAAMKRTAAGGVENAGGKFYTAIASEPYAKANLRAAFNTLPNGSARWNAMENTLKVFEAQSRRLPVGSATSENIATAARLGGGMGPRAINWLDEAIKDMRFGRNTGKLAEIFARTDSVDELVRISRLRPGTKEAADAVGRFVALETQAFNRPQQRAE